jgi:FkbM family methyltransferase
MDLNGLLRIIVRDLKYGVRLVRSRLRGSGWYSFKPGPLGPRYQRVWGRHFVITTPGPKLDDDLSQVLFPGRQPEWYIADHDVKIALENEIDFRTTFDVYAGGHYDRLNTNAVPGSIVWDIGANLGAASLIFAQNENVSHIYAYEPVPHTFAMAMRSFAANPRLSVKISPENLGIGRHSRDVRLRYTVKAKCAIGLADIPPRLKALSNIRPEDMEDITVRLADAMQVLCEIRTRHPNAPILLKLDAEGAEYEIIDRLIETGGIKEISAAAIEWHDSPGAEYLTSRLGASGFFTHAKPLEADESIGMIDAWR